MRVLAPAVTSLIPMTAIIPMTTSTVHTETLCDLIQFILTINVYFNSIFYINILHLHLTTYACKYFSFFDVRVSLNDGVIETVFNTKTTAKHQYLLRSSCRLSLAYITSAL